MQEPFTFIDRAVTLRYFSQNPVEVRLYLGDALEERITRAVAHYDQDHTLEQDKENLCMLLGAENGQAVLAAAGDTDRLGVLELVSFTVRRCREEQGKKLMALAGVPDSQSDTPCGGRPMAS